MRKRKIKNNLPKEEWGAILRHFGGRRNEMYRWLYENVPPKKGVKAANGQLVIFSYDCKAVGNAVYGNEYRVVEAE